MSDNLKPADRLKTMRAVKGKRTGLERRLFSMLAGMGISGWKQNAADIVGKPDVVFKKQRLAIFIDGCFWHGCPRCKRKLPRTNRSYWKNKIGRNRQLAGLYNSRLRKSGWKVVRIWEHEIRVAQDLPKVKKKIVKALVEI